MAMVFEVDRFRLVTANDVAVDELPKAFPAYRRLPLTGPWLLSARQPRPGAEHTDALFEGVDGVDVGQRPKFWQPYDLGRDRALGRSQPVSALIGHYPGQEADTRRGLAELHADVSTSRFLPVMARGDFVAVLDATGHLLGYLPLDGFF
ncbi:MAG: hypothetical protein M3Y55_02315 [Pseudomonadota bacterium]|nr:hypothetical protein [Pseudomonadota bacterium]